MRNSLSIDYTGSVRNGDFIAFLNYDINRNNPARVSLCLKDGTLSSDNPSCVNTFTVEEIRQIQSVLNSITDLIYSGEHVGSK